MDYFVENISEIMPVDFGSEPGAIGKEGTYTAAISGRGNVQVRLEERAPGQAAFVTLEAHPLSGLLTFEAQDAKGGVEFRITMIVRAANIFDWAAMKTVGSRLQNQNWRNTIRRLAEDVGGTMPGGIKTTRKTLTSEEAKAEEARLEELINRRKLSDLKAAV